MTAPPRAPSPCYEFVEIIREGALTILTIDRPGSHNALHGVAQRELAHAFDAFSADDSQWVAIITGKGAKAFCAGHDVKLEPAITSFTSPATGFGGLTARFDMAKPVIAAVNGVAMGGGFELALACDLIVAAEHAVFALPEPKVGLAALGGGIQRLPREIGLKRAMGMMLTGRRVTAREGFDLGFVNEVAGGDVMETARKWASDMLACSPMALRATKDAVHHGLRASIADGMKDVWDYPAMQKMLGSRDAAEGPAAFAEKRDPRWTGQ